MKITHPLMLDDTGKAIVTALNGIKNALSGGGSTPAPAGAKVEEKAVNFYDYDGTRLYSYTAAEVAELTELPANPTHEGLVSQGWNWSLSDIQDYMDDYPDAIMTIGQMYDTTNGDTKIHIKLTDYKEMCLGFYLEDTSGVVVDWGDGTTVTYDGTEANTHSPDYCDYYHTYTDPGEYTISVSMVNAQDELVFGDGVVGMAPDFEQYYYRHFITGVNFGSKESYWRLLF